MSVFEAIAAPDRGAEAVAPDDWPPVAAGVEDVGSEEAEVAPTAEAHWAGVRAEVTDTAEPGVANIPPLPG